MDNKLKNVKFKVVGVTFANEDGSSRQAIIKSMANNSPVRLKREPTNIYDKNAVAVFYMDQQIGYIGKQFAQILAPLMDQGRVFNAKIDTTDVYKSINYCHIIVDEE